MRWIVLVFPLLLAACTHDAVVQPMAPSDVVTAPDRRLDLPVSFYIADEILTLSRKINTGLYCNAHAYSVTAGPAITSSIRNTNQALSRTIVSGGTQSAAAPGVKRHIVFSLDTFGLSYWVASGRNSFGSAFAWLRLIVDVRDDNGSQIGRFDVDGHAESELGGWCFGDADIFADVTNQAIKQTMDKYAATIVDALQI